MSAEEVGAIARAQQQQILEHAAIVAKRAEEERAAERVQNTLALSLRHELLKVKLSRRFEASRDREQHRGQSGPGHGLAMTLRDCSVAFFV